jgi:hypothetical protein
MGDCRQISLFCKFCKEQQTTLTTQSSELVMNRFMELAKPDLHIDILIGMLFHFCKIQATNLDKEKVDEFRSFMITEITNRQEKLEYKNCLRLIQILPLLERGQSTQSLA